MKNEIWKDINGFVGLYQVSNLGRVKSLNRIVVRSDGRKQEVKERILKAGFNGNYYHVRLLKDGVTKTALVHRLVAEAFLPNVSNLPFVNHKDENKTNNIVDNLEWCDMKYNKRYSNAVKILQLDLFIYRNNNKSMELCKTN